MPIFALAIAGVRAALCRNGITQEEIFAHLAAAARVPQFKAENWKRRVTPSLIDHLLVVGTDGSRRDIFALTFSSSAAERILRASCRPAFTGRRRGAEGEKSDGACCYATVACCVQHHHYARSPARRFIDSGFTGSSSNRH